MAVVPFMTPDSDADSTDSDSDSSNDDEQAHQVHMHQSKLDTQQSVEESKSDR